MALIDEEGNLLGLVNIIDALVLLLAVAVVIAGGSLVMSSPDPQDRAEPATRYVTIDYGTVPAYLAEELSPGDVIAGQTSGDHIAITDVYAPPVDEEGVALTVRARVVGRTASDSTWSTDAVSFGGTTIRPGVKLDPSVTDLAIGGTVVDVGASESELDLETITVKLSLENVRSPLASSISVGQRERNAAGTYAEVTGTEVKPARVVVNDESGNLSLREHPVNKDVTLHVSLTVLNATSGYSYDGRRVAIDRPISLDFRTTMVEGTIVQIEES